MIAKSNAFWPLNTEPTALRIDFWSDAQLQGLVAGTVVCVLGAFTLAVICHAIGNAARGWLDDNGRRRW